MILSFGRSGFGSTFKTFRIVWAKYVFSRTGAESCIHKESGECEYANGGTEAMNA